MECILPAAAKVAFMKAFDKWNVTTSLPSEVAVYDSELPHRELPLSIARSDFGDTLEIFMWSKKLPFPYDVHQRNLTLKQMEGIQPTPTRACVNSHLGRLLSALQFPL